MAMTCVNGSRECDGCMRCCEGDDNELHCPVCGEVLNPDEQVFIDGDGFVIGCEYCLKSKYAEDVQECWEA